MKRRSSWKFGTISYLTVCLLATVLFISHTRRAIAQEELEGLQEARSLVASRQLAKAEQNLRSYVVEHPAVAAAHYLLGYVLMSEQKATASLAEYTAAAKLRDPSAEDLLAVAADYILLNDYADAEKWLGHVVQMEPENKLAWYYLGRSRYYEGHDTDAMAAFLMCLRLEPHDVRAETNLGLVYEGLRRDADATAAYKQAIDWQKDAPVHDAQPYLDLGSLLRRQEKPEEAVSYLQQAVALNPENPKMQEELGLAYEKLRQWRLAEASLQKAIALSPDSPSLHFVLGRVLRAAGESRLARVQFEITGKLSASRSIVEVPNFDLSRSVTSVAEPMAAPASNGQH